MHETTKEFVNDKELNVDVVEMSEYLRAMQMQEKWIWKKRCR